MVDIRVALGRCKIFMGTDLTWGLVGPSRATWRTKGNCLARVMGHTKVTFTVHSAPLGDLLLAGLYK